MTRFVVKGEFFYYTLSYTFEYNFWDLNVLNFIYCMMILNIASKADTKLQPSRYLLTPQHVTLFSQLDDSWTVLYSLKITYEEFYINKNVKCFLLAKSSVFH